MTIPPLRQPLPWRRGRRRSAGGRNPPWATSLLLLYLAAAGPVLASLTDDRAALLAVTQDVTNWESFQSGVALQGWMDGSPCDWTRVVCNDDMRVASLNLSCNGCGAELRGKLPPSLVNLTELQVLDLSGNALTGTLPPAWGSASVFRELRRLDLADNSLTGVLPGEWAAAGSFPLLRQLNLSYNDLTGSIPPSWSAPDTFTRLTSLDLATNMLSGALPTALADPTAMQAIQQLSLAGNRINSTLPVEWAVAGAFPSILELDLSRNELSGSLPEEWGGPTAFAGMSALSLYDNQLEGTLPATWGQNGGLANVTALYLDTNRLSGSLPPEWGAGNSSWPALRLLGLSSNQLAGSLPPGWGASGGMKELQQLFLSYNLLSGTVPPSWTNNLPALTDLWLRPANVDLCGTLAPNAGYTVCRINGSVCVPLENLTEGCGGSGTEGVVEAVVRILGYDLDPFTDQLELALQESLVELLGLASVGEVNILYADQLQDPLIRLDPGVGNHGGTSLAPGPPQGASAPEPASGSGRRRELLFWDMGGTRRALRQVTAPAAVSAGTPPPTAAAGSSPQALTFDSLGRALQAVDVTLNVLTGNTADAQKMGQELRYVAGDSPQLKEALMARNVNATETQLRFIGGDDAAAPNGGSGLAAGGPPLRGRTIPGDGGGSNASKVELIIGIVSGTVVAIVVAFLVVFIWLWRRAKHRHATVAASTHPPQGRWQKMLAIGSKKTLAHTDSGSATSSNGGGSGGTAAPATGRGLVFPPINIAETGIDIDMDNLFRSAGANSDRDSLASSGLMEGASGSAVGVDGVQLPRVPFSDWELRPEDIEICTRPDGRQWEIGAGAFGQVYKALLGGVQTVAVKMVGGQHDPAGQAQFCREVAILRSCRAANVVMFCGACVSGDKTMIVCEFMEGGDLWRILDKDRDRTVFGWYKRGKQVALDVASGLHYLHSHRIVHFDLKSQNILLARDGTAKIADVGLARILNRDYVTSLDMAGTFAWAAPELLLGARCTEKVDIYSFGIVLWEIVTGERPLRGQTRELRVPEECPPEVDALISRCMAADPAARPSAKDIHEALLAIPYPASTRGGSAAAQSAAASAAAHSAPQAPPAVSAGAPGGVAALTHGGAPATQAQSHLSQFQQAMARGFPSQLPPAAVTAADSSPEIQIGPLSGQSGPQSDSQSGAPIQNPLSKPAADSAAATTAPAADAAAADSAAVQPSGGSGTGDIAPRHFWGLMRSGVNPFAAPEAQRRTLGDDAADNGSREQTSMNGKAYMSPQLSAITQALHTETIEKQGQAAAAADVQQAARQLEAEAAAQAGPAAAEQRWPPVQPVVRMQSPFVSPFSVQAPPPPPPPPPAAGGP